MSGVPPAGEDVTAHVNRIVIRLHAGDASAVDDADDLLRGLRARQSARVELILLLSLVPALLDRGLTDRALREAERAAELAARGRFDHRVLAWLVLAAARAAAADGVGALAMARQALAALDARRRSDAAAVATLVRAFEPALARIAPIVRGDPPLAALLLRTVDARAAGALGAPGAGADDALARELAAALAEWRAAGRVTAGGRVGTLYRTAELLFPGALAAAGAVGPEAAPPDAIVAAVLADARGDGDAPLRAAGPAVADEDRIIIAARAALLCRSAGDARCFSTLRALAAGAASPELSGWLALRACAYTPPDAGLALLAATRARRGAAWSDRLRAEAGIEQARLLLATGRPAEAAAHAAAAERDAAAAGNETLVDLARANAATAALDQGRWSDALPAFEALLARQLARGEDGFAAVTRSNIAICRAALGLDDGDADAAAPDLEVALARAARAEAANDAAAARAQLEAALATPHSGAPAGTVVDAHVRLARLHRAAGESARAQAALAAAVRAAHEAGDARALSAAYAALAAASAGEARLSHADRALAEARRTGDDALVARRRADRGAALLALDRHADAAAEFEAALAHDDRRETRFGLASAWIGCGATDRARPVLDALAADAGDDAVLAILIDAARADAAAGDGDVEDAIARLEAALRRAHAAAPALVPMLTDRLGLRLTAAGRAAHAVATLEEGLVLARGTDGADTPVVLSLLHNLGMALAELGDVEAARRAFEQTQAAARRSGDLLLEGRALFGLGNVHELEGAPDRAREHFAAALEAGRQAGHRLLQANALSSMARVDIASGRARSAAADLDRAAGLHAQLGTGRDEIVARTALLQLRLVLGELGAARQELVRIRALLGAGAAADLAPEADFCTAMVLAAEADWPAARPMYRRSLSRLEAARGELADVHARRRWTRQRANRFELAAEAALRADDPRAALEFLEANRTRLLEGLAARRDRRPPGIAEPDWIRYERALDHRQALARQRLLALGQGDAGLRADIERADRALAAAAVPVEQARAASAATAGLPAFETLAAAIPPGAAVVSLYAGNTGTLVVCAGRDPDGRPWAEGVIEPGFRRHELAALVGGSTALPAVTDDPGAHEPADLGWAALHSFELPVGLADGIVAHVCDVLGRRVWPAVLRCLPDDASTLLLAPGPGFAVLPLGAARLADGTPVDELVTCIDCPSLWLLARARGHPLLPGAARLTHLLDPTDDLPFARAEGHAVGRAFDAALRRAYVGPAATAPAALRGLEAADILHFAGHGTFSAVDPFRSALLCAPSPGSDGELSFEAVHARVPRIRSRLVMLSACETATLDASDRLNDFVSLPALLVLLGARAVVAAAWRVDDRAAALLLGEFARRWRAGEPAGGALRAARDWLRRAPAATLAERAGQWAAEAPGLAPDLAGTLEAWRADPAARPFAEPWHWAAWTMTGWDPLAP